MPATPPDPRRPTGRSGAPADGWWPPPSTPIAVEGGLQARSQRGRIGDTWWSQRFIAVLESFGIGSRLQRGKRYARTGQVLTHGGRRRTGDGLGAGFAGQALPGVHRDEVLTTLPSGRRSSRSWPRAPSSWPGCWRARCPRRSKRHSPTRRSSLFPASADELDSACSCPDWENPCKHIAAVYFLLAEAFDGDPFLIFAWRGRTKEELLAGLRARRRGSDSAKWQSRTG